MVVRFNELFSTKVGRLRRGHPHHELPLSLGADGGVDAALRRAVGLGVIDEETRWRRLAALLPPDDAARFMDCWRIGEQEAGLDQLVTGLLEHQAPISETVRAEISVASEVWGMRTALAPNLDRCLGDRQGDGALTLIEPDDAVQASGADLSTDAALAGLLIVPWIACTRSGQVLARAHDREPWNDLSLLPMHHVLFTPGQSTSTALFAPDSAWDAWTELRTSCVQTWTPASSPVQPGCQLWPTREAANGSRSALQRRGLAALNRGRKPARPGRNGGSRRWCDRPASRCRGRSRTKSS